MIPGLRKFLEKKIKPMKEVKSIFPGEIKPKKGVSSTFRIQFQYRTKTGAKLLAYSSSAVQEVFVVTTNPEALKNS